MVSRYLTGATELQARRFRPVSPHSTGTRNYSGGCIRKRDNHVAILLPLPTMTSPLPPANTPIRSSTSTPNSTDKTLNNPVKRFRTAAERKAQLESDPWIDSTRVFPKKVHCLGCGNDVKLDARVGAEYYPSLWNKHKVVCIYIKEGRRKEKEETGESDQAWKLVFDSLNSH